MKRDLDPLDWQERHSPTEAVEVRVTGERKRVATRRRKQDARIFDGLSSYHEQAMMDILAAYLYAVGDVGFKCMRYERVIPGTRPHFDRGPELRAWYLEWCEKAKRGAFKVDPALSIIVNAKSYLQTAAIFNKRPSWVKGNFHDCLVTYCEVRGWPKKINR